MAAPPPASRKRNGRAPKSPPKNMLFGHEISFRTFVWAASTATVFLVAIVAYNNAHPIIEPSWPGSRGYVREYADDTATKKVKPIETWKTAWENDYGSWRALQTAAQERNTLVLLEQNLSIAHKELKSNPESVTIKGQVGELEVKIKQTKGRIQDYEAAAIKK